MDIRGTSEPPEGEEQGEAENTHTITDKAPVGETERRGTCTEIFPRRAITAICVDIHMGSLAAPHGGATMGQGETERVVSHTTFIREGIGVVRNSTAHTGGRRNSSGERVHDTDEGEGERSVEAYAIADGRIRPCHSPL